MEFHELSSLFPPMAEEEFKSLVVSIGSEGLLEPITLLNGKILDGVHRYKACLETDTPPDFIEFNGNDPLSYVIGKNKERRHLTTSQLAAVAIKIEKYLAKLAKERQRHGYFSPSHGKEIFPEDEKGQARDQAAKIVGTNPRYVSDAKKLEKEAPDIFEQVRIGTLNIPQAKREIKKREREKENQELLEKAANAPTWLGNFEINKVYVADVQAPNFIDQVPAESVDLVFTDPPWEENATNLFEQLGKIGAHVLRPGCFLLSYTGKMFLPQTLQGLSEYLEYVWTFGIFQPDSNDRINKWHLYSAWRPVLVFRKPGLSRLPIWTPDSARSTRSKKYHDWEQGIEPVTRWIKAFSQVGEIVLDPFCGGGTIPLAAKRLQRRWIAFDINSKTAKLALKRITDDKTKI